MLHNLSNAMIESTNTELRVLHRMAFGFRQLEHLIALALLDRVATAHRYRGVRLPDRPTDEAGEPKKTTSERVDTAPLLQTCRIEMSASWPTQTTVCTHQVVSTAPTL
jgi:hypothetical protein